MRSFFRDPQGANAEERAKAKTNREKVRPLGIGSNPGKSFGLLRAEWGSSLVWTSEIRRPSPTVGDTALSCLSWVTGVGGESLAGRGLGLENLKSPGPGQWDILVLSGLLSHPPATGQTPALATRGAAFPGEAEAQDGAAVGSSGPWANLH